MKAERCGGKVKSYMVFMLYLDIHINMSYIYFLLATAKNGKPCLVQEQTPAFCGDEKWLA